MANNTETSQVRPTEDDSKELTKDDVFIFEHNEKYKENNIELTHKHILLIDKEKFYEKCEKYAKENQNKLNDAENLLNDYTALSNIYYNLSKEEKEKLEKEKIIPSIDRILELAKINKQNGNSSQNKEDRKHIILIKNKLSIYTNVVRNKSPNLFTIIDNPLEYFKDAIILQTTIDNNTFKTYKIGNKEYPYNIRADYIEKEQSLQKLIDNYISITKSKNEKPDPGRIYNQIILTQALEFKNNSNDKVLCFEEKYFIPLKIEISDENLDKLKQQQKELQEKYREIKNNKNIKIDTEKCLNDYHKKEEEIKNTTGLQEFNKIINYYDQIRYSLKDAETGTKKYIMGGCKGHAFTIEAEVIEYLNENKIIQLCIIDPSGAFTNYSYENFYEIFNPIININPKSKTNNEPPIEFVLPVIIKGIEKTQGYEGFCSYNMNGTIKTFIDRDEYNKDQLDKINCKIFIEEHKRKLEKELKHYNYDDIIYFIRYNKKFLNGEKISDKIERRLGKTLSTDEKDFIDENRFIDKIYEYINDNQYISEEDEKYKDIFDAFIDIASDYYKKQMNNKIKYLDELIKSNDKEYVKSYMIANMNNYFIVDSNIYGYENNIEKIFKRKKFIINRNLCEIKSNNKGYIDENLYITNSFNSFLSKYKMNNNLGRDKIVQKIIDNINLELNSLDLKQLSEEEKEDIRIGSHNFSFLISSYAEKYKNSKKNDERYKSIALALVKSIGMVYKKYNDGIFLSNKELICNRVVNILLHSCSMPMIDYNDQNGIYKTYYNIINDNGKEEPFELSYKNIGQTILRASLGYKKELQVINSFPEGNFKDNIKTIQSYLREFAKGNDPVITTREYIDTTENPPKLKTAEFHIKGTLNTTILDMAFKNSLSSDEILAIQEYENILKNIEQENYKKNLITVNLENSQNNKNDQLNLALSLFKKDILQKININDYIDNNLLINYLNNDLELKKLYDNLSKNIFYLEQLKNEQNNNKDKIVEITIDNKTYSSMQIMDNIRINKTKITESMDKTILNVISDNYEKLPNKDQIIDFINKKNEQSSTIFSKLLKDKKLNGINNKQLVNDYLANNYDSISNKDDIVSYINETYKNTLYINDLEEEKKLLEVFLKLLKDDKYIDINLYNKNRFFIEALSNEYNKSQDKGTTIKKLNLFLNNVKINLYCNDYALSKVFSNFSKDEFNMIDNKKILMDYFLKSACIQYNDNIVDYIVNFCNDDSNKEFIKENIKSFEEKLDYIDKEEYKDRISNAFKNAVAKIQKSNERYL